MKKLFFLLAALCMGMCAMAQSSVYVHEKGGKCTEFLIENLDSISFTKGTAVISSTAVISGTENGYDYVDLGLPSGLKWATCNVGATNPEDYGNYYAWCEITTKTTYDWSTYKYANGSYTTLTKYCDSSSYGTVDNKTTLEAADDVATQNWGGNWRIPTIDEWEELLKNCDWKWTDNYNSTSMAGYIVSSKTNDNSIFLPAAGYHSYDELGNAGSDGYYWSSSLYTGAPYYARRVYFYSDDYHNTLGNYRNCGQSVRPVVK